MISSWGEGAAIPPDSFLRRCQMPTAASATAWSATDEADTRSVIGRAGGARREWNPTAGALGCSLTRAICEQCAGKRPADLAGVSACALATGGSRFEVVFVGTWGSMRNGSRECGRAANRSRWPWCESAVRGMLADGMRRRVGARTGARMGARTTAAVLSGLPRAPDSGGRPGWAAPLRSIRTEAWIGSAQPSPATRQQTVIEWWDLCQVKTDWG